MQVSKRSKEMLQSLFVILILVGVFWINSDRLGLLGRPDGEAANGSACAPGDSYDDECEEFEFDEVREMPAYVDLQQSMTRLAEARRRLSRLAAEDSETDILAAANSYRKTIDEVRAGFARLKNRVAPDVFPTVAEDLLFWSYDGDYPECVGEWEVGEIAQGLDR